MKKLLLLLLVIYSFPVHSQLLSTISIDAGKVTSVCFLTNKPEIALGTSDGVILFYDYQGNVNKKKVKSRYDDIIKLISDPNNEGVYALHEGKSTGSSNNTFNYWALDGFREKEVFTMSNPIGGFDFYNNNNSAIFNTIEIKHFFNYVYNYEEITTTSFINIYNGETRKFTEYPVEKMSYKDKPTFGLPKDSKDYKEFYWNDIRNLDNNRILFYGLQGSDFVVFDLSQKKVVSDFVSRNELDATEFDVSPDNTRLVNGSYSKENWIYLWDIPTAKSINTLKGHNSLVKSVNFSPDGNYIASGDKDGKAILWDVKTGKIVNEFNAHNKEINQIRFSPDGKILITCSDDGTAKIWDAVKIIPDINVFATQYDFTNGIELKLKEEMSNQIEDINKSFKPKGEFETTEAFELRLKEKDEKINSIKQYYDLKISELKKEKESEYTTLKQEQDEITKSKIDQSRRDTILNISNISSYNADKQTFAVTIKGITRDVFIPIDQAPQFKENWKKSKVKCQIELMEDLKNYKFYNFIIINPITNEEISFDNSSK